MTRLLGIAVVLFGGARLAWAIETLSALDFVTADAAICLEAPRLDQTWKTLESSELTQRLSALPAVKRLLDSPGFQHWKGIDDKVASQTGRKISSHLRALFGNSLVVAIYIPASGEPQGILIGEALDTSAVETAVATWGKLDPGSSVTVKTFQGQKYHQRHKQGHERENLYYVASGRWFAISDQEALVQGVIQRYLALTKSNERPVNSSSLNDSSQFQKSRQRLRPDASAYLYLNARPWDRGFEESLRHDKDLLNPARLWKHVRSISACLDFRNGAVCDAVIEIESANLPGGWSQVVATGTSDPDWGRRISGDALLAISGHAELASLIKSVLAERPANEQAELAKNRRLAQSLLGGQELFDAVLPTLGKDFCATVSLRSRESKKPCLLDGTISFTTKSPGDAKMLQDVTRGLETGMSLLAAYFSVEGKSVVTVAHDQTGGAQLSWLTDAALVPVAYGLKSQTLVIAGSPERLRQTMDLAENPAPSTRLTEHAQRYFPDANQLIWLDAAQVRASLSANGQELARFFAHDSAQEEQRFLQRFESAKPYLRVFDSYFLAGRVQSDSLRVTFGGGLDASAGRTSLSP